MTVTTRVGSLGLAALSLSIAAAVAVGGAVASRPHRPDAGVLALSQRVTALTQEFAALEVQRFVPPVDGAALDAYSLRLEQGAHKLEDVTAVALTLPLYDLAAARSAVDKAAAAAHLQHGLVAVRAVLDVDLGPQAEANEADVVARLRLALVDVDAVARR